MIEAVLRVHLPCTWVAAVTEAPGASLSIVEQKPIGDGLLQSLVEVDPGEADPEAILEVLRANPFVAEVEAATRGAGRLLLTLKVRECDACNILVHSKCFLTDATATESEGLEWHLVAPKGEDVEALVRSLGARGLDAELAAVRPAKAEAMLTDRQESVISLAYDLGYFEFPKRIKLTQLAGRLGVSKSTLSEILRAGEAKILHAYFHGLVRGTR